ncbi:MAG: energy-coupling factor ABC transporter ATP-binding protein, partial [Candidatus Bipolaricaulia bacterium]
AAVKIRGLNYVYPDGTRALKDIDLEILDLERVALIGPNGAGKTTLLLHLNGLLRGEGEIGVLERPLGDGAMRAIRENVGLVFQDPDDQLFMPRVFDDVAFGPLNLGLSEAEVQERVTEALQIVNMEGHAERPPHHLSFGERKRVALAAILAMRPKVLALDEPSSNLDPQSRRELIGLLRGLETTLIVATHDLELVLELCSRAVLLDRGELIADGPARELLADEQMMLAHGLEVPLSLRLARADGGLRV